MVKMLPCHGRERGFESRWDRQYCGVEKLGQSRQAHILKNGGSNPPSATMMETVTVATELTCDLEE